ncbi:hypothetical protein CDV36_015803 [Fusarium kuroshium]|uniref:Uncharacterized protein n=1 Tax=Fusarium kuroshium TaxID=2010991 RepID=A0A3M2R835_9HYPO|nr:hypothetical protein CDV36_015803 [Fusarium kuroshium]
MLQQSLHKVIVPTLRCPVQRCTTFRIQGVDVGPIFQKQENHGIRMSGCSYVGFDGAGAAGAPEDRNTSSPIEENDGVA